MVSRTLTHLTLVHRRMKTLFRYLVSTLSALLFSIFYNWSLTNMTLDVFSMFLMGLSVASTFLIALLNLMYFLPFKNLKIRYITPSLIAFIIFCSLWSGTVSEGIFFLAIATLNLIWGIVFLKKEEKLKQRSRPFKANS